MVIFRRVPFLQYGVRAHQHAGHDTARPETPSRDYLARGRKEPGAREGGLGHSDLL